MREIILFVLPPRSPKLNGRVERAHRTHREEFYEVADLGWTVAQIRPHLLAWERIYNTVRPHQALGYKTPWRAVCENSVTTVLNEYIFALTHVSAIR